MEEASRNEVGTAQTVAREAEQQRLAEIGRFFAEIGPRATLHALSMQDNAAPEAPALKKLLGAVALMSTAGVQANLTWAGVSHWVLVKNQGSTAEEESKSLPAVEELGMPSRKRGREEVVGSQHTDLDSLDDGSSTGGFVCYAQEGAVPFGQGLRLPPSSSVPLPPTQAYVDEGAGVASVPAPCTPLAAVNVALPHGAVSWSNPVHSAAASPLAGDRELALHYAILFCIGVSESTGFVAI